MRILHIMGRADINGIASTVYNYMSHIDQSKYRFDIALTGNKPGYLGHEMQKLGARLYELPLKSTDVREFIRQLDAILKNDHYDIIHVHSNSTSWVALLVARRNGIRCRIAHAHSAVTQISKRGRFKFYSGRLLNYSCATKLVACGTEVARCAFGETLTHSKKVMILPNAIDTERFRFNSTAREEVREELGISSRYVLGMVGRISPVKNHVFALKVLCELVQDNDDISLVVVGDGPLTNHIKAYCATNSLSSNVLFTGVKSDAHRMYQAFDAFIMPSHYEGMPIAALEALTTGLPVILSNAVTQELSFSKNVTYLPLELDAWVEHLNNRPHCDFRDRAYAEIAATEFDIRKSAKILTDVYDAACSMH